MPRKRKQIQKALTSKGFWKTETSHHTYYDFYYRGKKTGINTHLSRGTKYKDYSDALLRQMRKQLKLDNVQELLDLIDCPMDENAYQHILRAKELLE